LAILREAGLVAAERHGQTILYELNTSVFQELVQHLADWARPTGRDPKRRKAAVRPREA
jgi:hypothetical protein